MPGRDHRVRGSLIERLSLPSLLCRTDLGGGLALRRRSSGTDSGLAVVPSLIVTAESHALGRLIEGDIQTSSRGTATVLRGGFTVEFGRVLVRPYVALIAADNGWLTAGVRFGLTF